MQALTIQEADAGPRGRRELDRRLRIQIRRFDVERLQRCGIAGHNPLAQFPMTGKPNPQRCPDPQATARGIALAHHRHPSHTRGGEGDQGGAGSSSGRVAVIAQASANCWYRPVVSSQLSFHSCRNSRNLEIENESFVLYEGCAIGNILGPPW